MMPKLSNSGAPKKNRCPSIASVEMAKAGKMMRTIAELSQMVAKQ